MGKSRDRANRSGSDPVNIGTSRLSVDSGNIKVTAQDGTTFKKIFAEEVQVGSGNNRVIFKRGSDGKAQFQSTTDGGGSTSNLQVGGSSTVTNPSDLPITGNSAGDTVLVTSTNNLMIYNGSGWYKIATITNSNPVITSAGDASYGFATDGTPVSIEIVASDPEGVPLQYKYQVTTGSLGSTATVTNSATSGGTYSALAANTLSNNRFFKVTPSTNEAHAGTFAITFSVTDGVNTANSSASSFTLGFNVSGSYAFDGTGDYAITNTSNDLVIGSNDFTAECWIYTKTFSGVQGVIDRRRSGDAANYDWTTYLNTDNTLNFYASGGTRITSSALNTHRWYHTAVVKKSGTTTLYVDGKTQGTWGDSATYPSNQMTFGSYGPSLASLWYNGYASNLRMVVGSDVYTPTSASGGSTVFSAGHSLKVPSSGTSNDLVIGTNDFTLEFWVNLDAIPSPCVVYDTRESHAAGLMVNFNTSGNLRLYANSSYRITCDGISTGDWHHYAIVRRSGTTKVYLDGVADSETYSDSNNYTGNTAFIGKHITNAAVYDGYISNLRLVVGTAVYTSNFTVPNVQLTAITNTKLLTCQNSSGSITDASSSNHSIDVTTAAASTQKPFVDYFTVPTSELTNVTNTKLLTFTEVTPNNITNGAYHFTSNTSKLRVDSAEFDLTSGTAFTIEMWYYLVDAPDSRALWDFGNGNAFQFYKISGQMKIYGLGGSYVIDFGSGVGSTLNKWYHVAITGDGSNNVKAYLDGTQVGSTYNASWTLSGSKILLNGNLALSQPDSKGVEAYFSDFRVVNGTQVYTGNFTRPSGPLTTTGGTYPSNTNVNTSITASHTKLLTCQNSSGAKVDNSPSAHTFIASGTVTPRAGIEGASADNSSSSHTLTLNGDTTHSYVTPFAQGTGGSVLFDGTGDHLEIPNAEGFYDLGTADWTIECWVYFTDTSGFNGVFQLGKNVGALAAMLYSDGKLKLLEQDSAVVFESNTTFSANTWYHIAYTNDDSSNTQKLYVNGVVESNTGSKSTAYNFTEKTVFIGGRWFSSAFQRPMNGYISNFRIVAGTVLYTTNFTVPTSKLTAVTNTKLLTCNDSNVINDASSSIYSITVNGDAAATRFNPF